MARDGFPDDPNYSDSDPTQYANFGGTGGEAYSEYQQRALARDAVPTAADFTTVMRSLPGLSNHYVSDVSQLSGQRLRRIQMLFENLALADTSPALEQIELVLSPRLAAHRSAIYLNSGGQLSTLAGVTIGFNVSGVTALVSYGIRLWLR